MTVVDGLLASCPSLWFFFERRRARGREGGREERDGQSCSLGRCAVLRGFGSLVSDLASISTAVLFPSNRMYKKHFFENVGHL